MRLYVAFVLFALVTALLIPISAGAQTPVDESAGDDDGDVQTDWAQVDWPDARLTLVASAPIEVTQDKAPDATLKHRTKKGEDHLHTCLTVRSRESDPRREIPSDGFEFSDAQHIRLTGGKSFEPGAIYDLYPADEQGYIDYPYDPDTFQRTDLEAWLKNPPDRKAMYPEPGIDPSTGELIKPRGMPDLGLTDEQVDALVEYLTTLQ